MPSTDPTSTTAEARRALGHRPARHTGQPDRERRPPPTEQNIRDWCAACAAEADVPELIATARAVDSAYQEWARLSRAGMKRLSALGSIASYRRTTRFRIHEPLVMPGIFQTEAYYRAMIKFWYEFLHVPDDTEAAVADRHRRTAVALQSHRRITAVLGEQALYTRETTPTEQADQLAHLLDLQRRRNITVSVIPADAQRYAVSTIGFWIFDDNAVALETPTAAIKVTRPAEIGRYVAMFDALQAEAAHGHAARTLIEEALASARALVDP